MIRSENNIICTCRDRICTHYSHNIPVKRYEKKYDYSAKSKL